MSALKHLVTEIHHRSLWQVLLICVRAAWACFELMCLEFWQSGRKAESGVCSGEA